MYWLELDNILFAVQEDSLQIVYNEVLQRVNETKKWITKLGSYSIARRTLKFE